MLSNKHFLLGGTRCTAISLNRGLCESSLLAILIVFCRRNRPGPKRFRDISYGVGLSLSFCSLRRTLRIAGIRMYDNTPAPTRSPISRAVSPDAKKWPGSRRSDPPTCRTAPSPVCFLCLDRGNRPEEAVWPWYGQRSVNSPHIGAIFWLPDIFAGLFPDRCHLFVGDRPRQGR